MIITNISNFYIIDISNMVAQLTLSPESRAHRFVINYEIQRMVSNASRSKRYTGVIYTYDKLNENGIHGLKKCVYSVKNECFDEFVLIDYYDTPKHKKLYPLFDEVFFIYSYKKGRIIK